MNIKDVENLSNLARIEIAEDEKKGLLSDMNSILGYVKQIEEIKLDEIKAEYDLTNVYREDKPEKREFEKDLIISQFPEAKDGFLKVKKIL